MIIYALQWLLGSFFFVFVFSFQMLWCQSLSDGVRYKSFFFFFSFFLPAPASLVYNLLILYLMQKQWLLLTTGYETAGNSISISSTTASTNILCPIQTCDVNIWCRFQSVSALRVCPAFSLRELQHLISSWDLTALALVSFCLLFCLRALQRLWSSSWETQRLSHKLNLWFHFFIPPC